MSKQDDAPAASTASATATATASGSSSSNLAHEISEVAYCKMILHACKYPARPVLGVLLSTKSGADEKSAKAKGGGIIVDAAPLFHNYPLAPMLEVAMIQLEEYCKLNGGLVIAGVYYANELANDTALNGWTLKLANKIVELYPTAVVLQIHNSAIGQLSSAIQTFRCSNAKWHSATATSGGNSSSTLATDVQPSATTLVRTRTAVLKGRTVAAAVYDMDDHLEDVSRRWIGQPLPAFE